jgi:hypothetical protein
LIDSVFFMKKFKLLFGFTLLGLATFFLSGCAFSVDKKNLNYSYTGQIFTATPNNKSISIGTIVDRRIESNPNMILHKSNQYGVTTGGWEAEKPIAEIVADGLRQALKGQQTSSPANFELSGSLESLACGTRMGFFTGEFIVRLEVNLSLHDVKTGEQVWNESLVGNADIPASGDYIHDGFTKALDDLISQLKDSETFAKALK